MLVREHDDLSPGQISVVVVPVNTGVKDWKGRHGSAKEIRVDAAERENPSAKEMPPEDYPCPALDWQCPGQLINMIGSLCVGDAAVRSCDMLGCKHEYFLSQLKRCEGRRGGESPASFLAKPPFNVTDWGGERLLGKRRRRHGVRGRKGTANFPCARHMARHVAARGLGALVLAGGSISSSQPG